MTRSLNTARALLKAENFEGARKLVNKALETEPYDLESWCLRVEIECEAEEYEAALRICRNALPEFPESIELRFLEIDALFHLRWKKAVRRAVEKFKIDFPDCHDYIDSMEGGLDALAGRTDKLNKYLDGFDADALDMNDKREHGMLYHKTGSMYRAQPLMEAAHPYFPEDLELNKSLAMNSMLLGKLATARKYARIALRLKPGDRHMRVLIVASYLYYYPVFYIFNALMSFFCLVNSYLGVLGGVAALIFATIYARYATDFLEGAIAILIGNDVILRFDMYYVFVFIFILVQIPGYLGFLYKTKQNVKLERY